MSDDAIPVNLPDCLPVGSLEEFNRQNAGIFETRRWVQDALLNHGAGISGAGCGMGEADIDFSIGAEQFNMVIRPRK